MRQLTDKAAPSTAAPHDCPMRPRVAAHRQGRAFNGCAPRLSEAPLCGCSQKRPRLLMAAPLDRPMRPWLAAHGHGRASNGCASHTTNAPLVRLPRDTAAPLMVAPQKSPSAPPCAAAHHTHPRLRLHGCAPYRVMMRVQRSASQVWQGCLHVLRAHRHVCRLVFVCVYVFMCVSLRKREKS